MSQESIDDVYAMFLTEISAAMAGNIESSFAQAKAKQGTSAFEPATLFELFSDTIQLNIDLLGSYIARFAADGNQTLLAWCESMIANANRQLDLLDKDKDPAVALKDFSSGVVSALDEQGSKVVLGGGSEKVFKIVGESLDGLDILNKLADGDVSAALAVYAGSFINTVVTGILTTAAVATGAVSWPVIAGIAAIGAIAGVVGGDAANDLVEDFFEFAKEPEDQREDAYQSIVFQIKNGGSTYLPRLGDYLAFGTDDDDQLSAQYLQGSSSILIGGSGNDILYGGDLVDKLNGGAGNDILIANAGYDILNGAAGDDHLNGGRGSDTLQGGNGFDTYEFQLRDFSNISEDIIIDTDGFGKITFDNVAIGDLSVNNVSRDGLGWETQDRAFRLQVTGTGETSSLVITHRESGGRIVVRNWSNGDLSITLPELGQPGTPENSHILTNENDQVGHDGKPDEVPSGDDFISALGGNDGVDGGYGNDWIDGGHGNDLVLGGPGSNRLIGGMGDDVLLGVPMLLAWTEPKDLDAWYANTGARNDVINFGKGWYTHIEGGAPVAGDATQNVIGFQVSANHDTGKDPWIETNPNVLPSGEDDIDAGDGSDVAYGGESDDEISGGTGNDLLVGGSDNDIIKGEEDDDLIFGDDLLAAGGMWDFVATQVSSRANTSGNDTLMGGSGNDRIYGQGGHDVIDGGNGNDILQGDRIDYGLPYAYASGGVAGNDFIDGGEGDDQIYGDGGSDTLRGGSGADYIVGDSIGIDGSQHGNDNIDGGNGADTVIGLGGDDVIRGGEGNDLLAGDGSIQDIASQFHGNDSLYGQAGDDELQGNGGNDYLDGGTGKDLLSGQDGNDTLHGGDGNDVLEGGAGQDGLFGGNDDDRLLGEDGDDLLSGDNGKDELYGGAGNDRLSGGAGADTLGGGVGNDSLDGGDGNDLLDGEAGNDTIYGGTGNDTIDGDDGNDLIYAGLGDDGIYGGTGNDVVHGEDGEDIISAAEGDDEVAGGAGNDVLNGDAGNDNLRGGEGDDNLSGGDGNDVLEGGEGNDILYGGEGNDRFHFEAGFGVDQIYFEDPGTSQDTITFGSSIQQSELYYEAYGLDLIIRHANGLDAVFVHNYFASAGSGGIAVGGIEVTNREGLEASLGVPKLVVGTDADDVMTGTSDDDSLSGVSGNDTLIGSSGNDRLFGGKGDDVFYGGTGNDIMDGGTGNDIYHYGYGDGFDRILNLGESDAGSDIIRIGSSLTRTMIQGVQITGNDLMIHFFDGVTFQSLVLDGFLSEQNSTHILEFSDGSWMSAQDFRESAQSWRGTEADENYTATDAHNNLQGNGGSDIIHGLGGNDRVFGGEGDDQLFGGDGNDVLDGGIGSDVLDGGAGDDQLLANEFSNGSPDVLRGGAGDDRYYISAGYMYSSSPDTVIELESEGVDTVYTESYSYTLTANVENLTGVFNHNKYHWQNPSYPGWVVNIPRSLVGNDLDNVIRFDAPPFSGKHEGRYYLLDGGVGNDTLIGTQASEIYVVDSLGDIIIEGDWGSDAASSIDTVRASISYSLANLANIDNIELVGAGDLSGWGNTGNNTLNGRTSTGSNHLYGGLGNDSYIIGANDTAIELTGEGNDTVIIDALEIDVGQGQWFDVASYANIENLQLGNNLIPDLRGEGTINGGVFHANLRGDAGDNTLTGNGFSNELRGGGGNDTLIGGEREPNTVYTSSRDYLFGETGNDFLAAGSGGADLYGGTGDDLLRGSWGNDDFHYAIGDGRDTVDSYHFSDTDRVIFAAGIDPDNVTFSRVDTDLIVQVGSDPNDKLIVSGYWYEIDGALVLRNNIKQFLFADGTVRRGDLHQLPFTNNPPQTHISSLEYELLGDATFSMPLPVGMFSDDAADTLTFSLGVNAPAWLSIDPATGMLTGTPPNGGDELYVEVVASDSWGQRAASSWNLHLRNVINGTAGGDILTGGTFRDDLHGGTGDDTLTGAGSLDRLYGGDGNDSYVVTDETQQIVELTDEGEDTVHSSSYRYELGDNVERLELQGSAYQGIGNRADNTIIGTFASNLLDGAGGNDHLIGGEGDDTYLIDSTGDQVIELDGQGEDVVYASLDWLLAEHVESLVLTGEGNFSATGNGLDNTLYGNGGNNRLDGGLGADWLYGGLGNDLYIIDSAQDQVFEEFDAGVDTVERRFETNLILADDVENLLLGTGVGTGNGNGLDNVITGNASANRLSGLDGDDTLSGGDGDDQLWGGTGVDTLNGNAGADYLDGGAGVDRMVGGMGNDIYVVDDSGDMIIELSGEGTDQVQSSATYTMGAELENLFLTGSAAVDGIGNALANYIAGNSANNVINGGVGNDTLSGGSGNDTLIGGSGNDAYLIGANPGSNLIDNSGGGNDTVFFQNGVTRERLSFVREGDDLLIRVDQGTIPAVRVRNHFLGGDWAMDQVQPDGGASLSAAQINQIITGGNNGGFDRTITGTAAGEQLTGTSGKDLIEGLAGNDTLFGMAGDDTLRGGDGNDQLAGGNGNAAGSGNDRLEGGAGNDTLRGQDGSNILIGGANDDQYIYGGGIDVIDNTGGGTDRLFFQSGITTSQLTFTRNGDNLVITVNGNTNTRVTVTGHFLGGDMALDFLQPASGSALNTAAINALVSNNGGGGQDGSGVPGTGNDSDYPSKINGTAAGEQIVGTNGRDLIKGLAGNDTLFGMAQDDKLEGGDGDDYLSGGNGSFSGSGTDILMGGAGADQLVGEDGNDVLFGGTGDDTYFYAKGSGADTIDNTGGGTDWLYFDAIGRSQLSYHRVGDDLIVRVDGDAGQQMRVLKHFVGGEFAIAFVQPGDGGSAITAAAIASQLTPMGGAAVASNSRRMQAADSGEVQRLVEALSAFGSSDGAAWDHTDGQLQAATTGIFPSNVRPSMENPERWVA